MKKNNFPATVVIVIIFFGAIFLLSGFCTGLFAWQAEMGVPDSLSPRRWYEALMIGSIALIPSGLMLWAALRQMRHGNNKISGIIFLIAGGFILLICLLSASTNTAPFIGLLFGLGVWSGEIESIALFPLLYFTVVLIAGLWLLRVAIKILRNKTPDVIDPETFD